jgi:hypothetical protein
MPPKDVKVTIGGEKARLADLVAPMPATITFTIPGDKKSSNVVTAIEAEYLDFEYRVKAVNAAGRKLSLTVAGAKAPVFDLAVMGGAKITRAGKKLQLSDLAPGMRVAVTIDQEGRLVQAVRVRKDLED